MTLKELQRHWRDYVWEFWGAGRRHQIPLRNFYYRCERKLVGRKKVPALAFYHGDDGSWANNPHLLRCDEDGDCYFLTFQTRDINKDCWKKNGRFVKLLKK